LEKKAVTENIIEIWKRTGKVSVIKSSGRCMVPLFDDGTPLMVKHVQPSEISIGDIAVFRSSDRTVAHRVIKIYHEGGRLYLLEKKDSGFEPGIISEDAVIGKVIGIQKVDGQSVNLEKGLWKLTNKLVGYYWSLSFSLYTFLRKFKVRIFKERNLSLASKVYSLVSSLLVNTAHAFISLIHRLSSPKNKQ
jgi:signal peptidase I